MDARSEQPVFAGCWMGNQGTQLRGAPPARSADVPDDFDPCPVLSCRFSRGVGGSANRLVHCRNIQTAKTRCADGALRECAFSTTTDHPGLPSPHHPRISAGPVRPFFSNLPNDERAGGVDAPRPVFGRIVRGPNRHPSRLNRSFSDVSSFCRSPFGPHPSVRGPSVRGPSVRGPSVRGPSVRGPSVRGPSVQGHLRHGRAFGRRRLSAMR